MDTDDTNLITFSDLLVANILLFIYGVASGPDEIILATFSHPSLNLGNLKFNYRQPTLGQHMN